MPSQLPAILVEGQDELDLFPAILGDGLYGQIRLVEAKGKDGFASRLKREIAESNDAKPLILGIVHDCDEDAQAVKQKVLAIWKIEAGKVAGPIPLLLLPSDNGTGSFEALCWQAVVASAELQACAQSFIDCVAEHPNGLGTQAQREKAKFVSLAFAATGMQTYRVGKSQQLVDPAHPAFDPIRQFARALIAKAKES